MSGVRILVLLGGLAAIVWSSRRWREGIKIALVLAIFEGALRKWVFPGAQDLVYFAKDVFLLGAYAGFLRQRRQLRYRPPTVQAVSVALVLLAVLGMLEVFNPNLPNLLVGVLGFKAYFFYVPLLYILPAVFPSDAALAGSIRTYLRIAIPVGLLALAQFFSPADSILNTYARSNEPITAITFGSSTYVRVTATFSFISGYTSYLLAMSILLLAWLGTTRWRFRGNLDLLVALGFTLLGMLMTGSRGPLLAFVVVLPLYWWLAIVRERQSGATLLRLLVGLGLIGILLNQFGGEAVGAFEGRASGSGVGAFLDRISTPFMAPLNVLPDVGLFGFGIGAAHQAATALAGGPIPFVWLRGLAVEAESGRILLELGPLGFLLLYFIRLYMAVFAFRQVLVLRTPFHRAMAVSSLLFFLVQIPGNIVYDVTSSLYFWTSGGLLLTAMKLDREAVRAAARAKQQIPARPALEPPLPAPEAT
jgi:hypothetical protein